MSTKKIFKVEILLCLLTLVIVEQGKAQYWGETVMEKSFERSDFFFQPIYINPYGLGTFNKVTPGLIHDPLLSLMINPALSFPDSTKKSYIYLDFRNSTIIEEDDYYIHPYYGYSRLAYDSFYYPFFYVRTRKELEPIISFAVITRPLNPLSIGATYQSVFQDEKYYAIPQDIYRSNIGYDYAGNRMLETTDIPIIDKYSGSDKMHQVGHFLSFFTAYEITNNLTAGFKLARALFNRDGSYGSNNFWESTWQYDNSSVYFNHEAREQDYDHWDLTGGINVGFTKNFSVGLTAGYLWGDVNQIMTQQDSSLYKNGQIGVEPNWSYYWKKGVSQHNWDHSGKTLYGGINSSLDLDASKKLIFYYTFRRQEIDILMNASLYDTSYSDYYSEWDSNYYKGNSDYALQDIRNGDGLNKTDIHRTMLALQWQIDRTKKLHLGFNVGLVNRKIDTHEDVMSNRHYYYFYRSTYYPEGDEHTNGVVEDKTLYWDFDAKLTEVQIPIIFTWELSESIEILFGLNRKMSNWQIDDVTLAIFDFREQIYDSTITKKTNFGERYTQPQEKMSDVSTAFIGGLTITPSKYFDIRLLFVPNFTDTYAGTTLKEFQWWIGLNLYP